MLYISEILCDGARSFKVVKGSAGDVCMHQAGMHSKRVAGTTEAAAKSLFHANSL